jgi:hypothetical protein
MQSVSEYEFWNLEDSEKSMRDMAIYEHIHYLSLCAVQAQSFQYFHFQANTNLVDRPFNWQYTVLPTRKQAIVLKLVGS